MNPGKSFHADDVPHAGTASADPQAFRDAMATLAATVCVVTCGSGDARLGRTVTAAISLGVAPPSILVSIAAGSELAARIRDTGQFSYAMLADTQDAIADAFAGKLAAAERFFEGDWQVWPSGQPRLNDSVASMDCVVANAFEAEGHILFVAHVRDIARSPERKPLLWYGRSFNAVQPLQRTQAPGADVDAPLKGRSHP